MLRQASRFCNLAAEEAADVLAFCATYGRAAPLEKSASPDWLNLLMNPNVPVAGSTTGATSVNRPAEIGRNALLAAGVGGVGSMLHDAFKPREKRKGLLSSGVTGALYGGLLGGGLTGTYRGLADSGQRNAKGEVIEPAFFQANHAQSTEAAEQARQAAKQETWNADSPAPGEPSKLKSTLSGVSDLNVPRNIAQTASHLRMGDAGLAAQSAIPDHWGTGAATGAMGYGLGHEGTARGLDKLFGVGNRSQATTAGVDLASHRANIAAARRSGNRAMEAVHLRSLRQAAMPRGQKLMAHGGGALAGLLGMELPDLITHYGPQVKNYLMGK